MKLVDIDARITALLWDDEHEEETTREMTIGAFLDEFSVEGLLEIPILSIPPHGRLIQQRRNEHGGQTKNNKPCREVRLLRIFRS